ncbi:MAG: hypothetical protein ACR5K4_03820 [Sodalis sp. (in: enterobacteria)]
MLKDEECVLAGGGWKDGCRVIFQDYYIKVTMTVEMNIIVQKIPSALM